jgi:hypothetical protein
MTASASSGRRIEFGVRILPPLPKDSKIHIGVEAGNYKFEFRPSLGRQLVRWLPVGFLIFWLYGWTQGETFALRGAFDPATPLGARLFLGFWTVGWTVGGSVAAVFALGLAFRPGNETLLVQRARLIWRPAYPLMRRFHGGPLTFFRNLLSIHRRSVTFPCEQVEDIRIVEQYDYEDHTPTDHLVLKCNRVEYELAADLSEDDLSWLCMALNTWKQAHG